jgi:hypothetical protein
MIFAGSLARSQHGGPRTRRTYPLIGEQCLIEVVCVAAPDLRASATALLYLASMRIIADMGPQALAATAQAIYGLVGIGGATAVLTLLSDWLYARFGPAGFWVMGGLCTAAFPIIWLLHPALAAFATVRRPYQRDQSQNPFWPNERSSEYARPSSPTGFS